MLRYLKKLEDCDIALNRSMIALGSCTMKLNSAAEMMPVSWREFSLIHPFAPQDQTEGYLEMIHDLSEKLCPRLREQGIWRRPLSQQFAWFASCAAAAPDFHGYPETPSWRVKAMCHSLALCGSWNMAPCMHHVVPWELPHPNRLREG